LPTEETGLDYIDTGEQPLPVEGGAPLIPEDLDAYIDSKLDSFYAQREMEPVDVEPVDVEPQPLPEEPATISLEDLDSLFQQFITDRENEAAGEGEEEEEEEAWKQDIYIPDLSVEFPEHMLAGTGYQSDAAVRNAWYETVDNVNGTDDMKERAEYLKEFVTNWQEDLAQEAMAAAGAEEDSTGFMWLMKWVDIFFQDPTLKSGIAASKDFGERALKQVGDQGLFAAALDHATDPRGHATQFAADMVRHYDQKHHGFMGPTGAQTMEDLNWLLGTGPSVLWDDAYRKQRLDAAEAVDAGATPLRDAWNEITWAGAEAASGLGSFTLTPTGMGSVDIGYSGGGLKPQDDGIDLNPALTRERDYDKAIEHTWEAAAGIGIGVVNPFNLVPLGAMVRGGRLLKHAGVSLTDTGNAFRSTLVERLFKELELSSDMTGMSDDLAKETSQELRAMAEDIADRQLVDAVDTAGRHNIVLRGTDETISSLDALRRLLGHQDGENVWAAALRSAEKEGKALDDIVVRPNQIRYADDGTIRIAGYSDSAVKKNKVSQLFGEDGPFVLRYGDDIKPSNLDPGKGRITRWNDASMTRWAAKAIHKQPWLEAVRRRLPVVARGSQPLATKLGTRKFAYRAHVGTNPETNEEFARYLHPARWAKLPEEQREFMHQLSLSGQRGRELESKMKNVTNDPEELVLVSDYLEMGWADELSTDQIERVVGIRTAGKAVEKLEAGEKIPGSVASKQSFESLEKAHTLLKEKGVELETLNKLREDYIANRPMRSELLKQAGAELKILKGLEEERFRDTLTRTYELGAIAEAEASGMIEKLSDLRSARDEIDKLLKAEVQPGTPLGRALDNLIAEAKGRGFDVDVLREGVGPTVMTDEALKSWRQTIQDQAKESAEASGIGPKEVKDISELLDRRSVVWGALNNRRPNEWYWLKFKGIRYAKLADTELHEAMLTHATEYAPVFFSELMRVVKQQYEGVEWVDTERLYNTLKRHGVKADEIEYGGSLSDLKAWLDGDGVSAKSADSAWGRENSRLLSEQRDADAALSRVTVDGTTEEIETATRNLRVVRDRLSKHSRRVHKDDLIKFFDEHAVEVDFKVSGEGRTSWGLSEYDEGGGLEVYGGTDYKEAKIVIKRPDGFTGGTYQSSHFPEADILLHIRFNTRTSEDGKKVLFIEEMQSDWHQEGREYGYRGAVDFETTPLTELEDVVFAANKEYADAATGLLPFADEWPEVSVGSWYEDPATAAHVADLWGDLGYLGARLAEYAGHQLKVLKIRPYWSPNNLSQVQVESLFDSGFRDLWRAMSVEGRRELLNKNLMDFGIIDQAGAARPYSASEQMSDAGMRAMSSKTAYEDMYQVLDALEPSQVASASPVFNSVLGRAKRAMQGHAVETRRIIDDTNWGDYIDTGEGAIEIGGVGVPDAPFKESWHQLGMKQMVRYAAENGFDRIGWTTGHEQAAVRYGTRKTYKDSVEAWGTFVDEDGVERALLVGREHKGGVPIDDIPGDLPGDLRHYENKKHLEAGIRRAERSAVSMGPEPGRLGVTEAVRTHIKLRKPLTLGGKGHIEFYDNKLKNFTNKRYKRFGVKVGEDSIDLSVYANKLSDATQSAQRASDILIRARDSIRPPGPHPKRSGQSQVDAGIEALHQMTSPRSKYVLTERSIDDSYVQELIELVDTFDVKPWFIKNGRFDTSDSLNHINRLGQRQSVGMRTAAGDEVPLVVTDNAQKMKMLWDAVDVESRISSRAELGFDKALRKRAYKNIHADPEDAAVMPMKYGGTVPYHAIDVTPELKAHVLRNGEALFQGPKRSAPGQAGAPKGWLENELVELKSVGKSLGVSGRIYTGSAAPEYRFHVGPSKMTMSGELDTRTKAYRSAEDVSAELRSLGFEPEITTTSTLTRPPGSTSSVTPRLVVSVRPRRPERLGVLSEEDYREAAKWNRDIQVRPDADELSRQARLKELEDEDVFDSPEFQRWFGDSKVVDEAGKPLRVYHGTPEGRFDEAARGSNLERERVLSERERVQGDIDAGHELLRETPREAPHWSDRDAFLREDMQALYREKEGLVAPAKRAEEEIFRTRSTGQTDWGYKASGAYFTDSRKVAEGYAGSRATKTPYVYETYLSIKKPYIDGVTKDAAFSKELAERIDRAQRNQRPEKWLESRERETALIRRQVLQKHGYDGEIWKQADGSSEYVVFNPRQIKSTQNVGTFDPEDPRILYQTGPTAGPPGGGSGWRGPRGAVEFEEGRAIITLFESADFSTLVHEIGHIFRRDMSVKQFKQAVAWVRSEGFEVSKSGVWSREAEEHFAEHFERYIASGFAPTPDMKNLFQRFKTWMKELYREIAAPSPEIARVFDDMLGESKMVTPESLKKLRGRVRQLQKAAKNLPDKEEVNRRVTELGRLNEEIADLALSRIHDFTDEKTAGVIRSVEDIANQLADLGIDVSGVSHAWAEDLERMVSGGKADLHEAKLWEKQQNLKETQAKIATLIDDIDKQLDEVIESAELGVRVYRSDLERELVHGTAGGVASARKLLKTAEDELVVAKATKETGIKDSALLKSFHDAAPNRAVPYDLRRWTHNLAKLQAEEIQAFAPYQRPLGDIRYPAPGSKVKYDQETNSLVPDTVHPQEAQKLREWRERIETQVRTGFVTDKYADAVIAVMDARARSWASSFDTPKNPDAWYYGRISNINFGKPRTGMFGFSQVLGTRGWDLQNLGIRGRTINPIEALARGAQATIDVLTGGKRIKTASQRKRGADVLIHELGHIFQFDTSPAQREVVNQWLRRHVGDKAFVKETGLWSTTGEELWARAFERYFYDGIAPTKALEKVFKKFRDWIFDVYAAVTGTAINVDISDDIRRVFDELLTASDDLPAKKIVYEEGPIRWTPLHGRRALKETVRKIGLQVVDEIGRLSSMNLGDDAARIQTYIEQAKAHVAEAEPLLNKPIRVRTKRGDKSVKPYHEVIGDLPYRKSMQYKYRQGTDVERITSILIEDATKRYGFRFPKKQKYSPVKAGLSGNEVDAVVLRPEAGWKLKLVPIKSAANISVDTVEQLVIDAMDVYSKANGPFSIEVVGEKLAKGAAKRLGMTARKIKGKGDRWYVKPGRGVDVEEIFGRIERARAEEGIIKPDVVPVIKRNTDEYKLARAMAKMYDDEIRSVRNTLDSSMASARRKAREVAKIKAKESLQTLVEASKNKPALDAAIDALTDEQIAWVSGRAADPPSKEAVSSMKEVGERVPTDLPSARLAAAEMDVRALELKRLAKELDYDLRDPGDVWREIEEPRRSSKAQAAVLEAQYKLAKGAFLDDELAKWLDRLSKDDRGKVLRAVKKKEFHTLPDDINENALKVARLLKEFFDEQLKRLQEAGFLKDFDKNEFFARVDVAGYIPHILNWAAKKKLDAIKGRFPSLSKPGNLKERKISRLLTQTNDWKRREVAEAIIHHKASAGEFGDQAVNAGRSGTLKNYVNNSDMFRRGQSASAWDELVEQTLKDAGLEEVYDFFNMDPVLTATQYLQSTDKAIAKTMLIDNILEMFPMGREFAERFDAHQADLIAAELGFAKLSKVDFLESVMRVRLPTGLRKFESYISTRLANGDPVGEILTGLREQGVGIDREIPKEVIQAFKKNQVYVPEQVVEYLRWMNSADTFGASWPGQALDGLHALAKAMVTIAAHAHIGMNWSGNVFSMSQQIGLRAINFMNWIDAMKISMAGADAGKWADDVLDLGDESMTYREWNRYTNERHVADVHGGSPFASEQLGAIEGYQQYGKRTGAGLVGQVAGAGVGYAAGAATGIPFAGAAGSFLGAQVGSALGELGIMGWKAFSNEAVSEFFNAVEALSSSPKNTILYGGKRIVGTAVGATVGSTLGPLGTAMGAVLGGMSFPSYVRVLTGLNQGVEATSRLTLMVGSMKSGLNMDEAVKSVNAALRDYGDLTPFERDVLRRFFFFYTWDAGNVAFQLKWMVKNPMQLHIANNFMAGMYKGAFTEQEAALLPEHMRWKILLRLAAAKVITIPGLPIDAFISNIRMDEKFRPVGLLSRVRPDLAMLFEWSFGDQYSMHYGKGWSQLTNARHIKNTPPLLRRAVGLQYSMVPVHDRYGEETGLMKEEVRAERPELWYLMQRLPGYRVLMEYNKIVTDSFMSRALDSGDPTAEASEIERALAFGFGARPYHIDFDGQAEWVASRLTEALLDAINSQQPYAVTRFGTLREEGFEDYTSEDRRERH